MKEDLKHWPASYLTVFYKPEPPTVCGISQNTIEIYMGQKVNVFVCSVSNHLFYGISNLSLPKLLYYHCYDNLIR